MFSMLKFGNSRNNQTKSEKTLGRNFYGSNDFLSAYESHDSRKRSSHKVNYPKNSASNLTRHVSNGNEINRPRTNPHAGNVSKKIDKLDKLDAERIEFLKEFSSKYGYNGKIESIRENEYPQLKGAVYLDHSGSTTYAKSIITSFHADLTRNLFGNPHSTNPSSSLTSHRVEEVRLRVLKHFNASPDDYQVIFTQNATAAIKVVGEMFPWTEKTKLKYLRESHNSLLGLRRFAEEFGSKDVSSIDEDAVEEMLRTNDNELKSQNNDEISNDSEMTYNLFGYPAQCNFSGQRFPLMWTQRIKKKLNTKDSKYLVLLDAAAFLTSSTLSLANKDNSPDFVAMSFYKIFGYPTGLGALLVKTELSPLLQKRYFGGGTIQAVAYDCQWQKFRTDLSERYEDGTINFLDIIALQHAFNVTERIYSSFQLIKPHVTALATYLDRRMRALKHWNGMPVCVIHSDHEYSDNVRQGPVVNFNVRKADGNWIGYGDIEKMASANGIHLRSGGHCNPGCVARWINISSDETIKNYQHGKICGDDKYIFNNKITGAVRISLGAMTTIDDIFTWLRFFQSYYVESVVPESETAQFYKQSAHNSSQTNLRKTLSTRNKRASISSPNLVLQLHDDILLKAKLQQKEKLPRERRQNRKKLT